MRCVDSMWIIRDSEDEQATYNMSLCLTVKNDQSFRNLQLLQLNLEVKHSDNWCGNES